MKDFFIRFVFLVIVLLVVPLLMSGLISKENTKSEKDKTISVYDKKRDEVFDIPLEDYIVNVVASEMPASFHIEALKAQAVCARTYALKKVNKNLSEHKGADVCTDFAHCQAYSNIEDLKKNWGNDYNKNIKKIKEAAEDTKGEVLMYGNEYAISVFHSCSNGKTENASDVWGGDYPYLVSVESMGDFEKSDYKTSACVTKDEFKKKINSIFESDIFLNEEILVTDYEMTQGENVGFVTVNNKKIKGTDIRKLFSLKSTSFKINLVKDNVVFDVYGNGHGVGMSQYGANSMAKTDFDYDEILSHYYRGTKLLNMYK